MTAEVRDVVDEFHRLYYYGPGDAGRIYERTSWMGHRCQKCPLDLWVYQEILFEVRPTLVVETGTLHGGSALYLANMLDLLGAGRVVTIDIWAQEGRPAHPRIEYVLGSSADRALVEAHVAPRVDGPVLVILDSDHSRDHVLAELELFAPLVTPGSYIIVEDTNVNGNPVEPDYQPGPGEAVRIFLERDGRFERDAGREKFLMTFNPGGYLRRRA